MTKRDRSVTHSGGHAPVSGEQRSAARDTPGSSHVAVIHSFAGPIPAPADLQEYARIDPALPATIIEWATREQQERHANEQHNRDMQAKSLAFDIEDRRAARGERTRGQWMIYTLLAASLVMAIVSYTQRNYAVSAMFLAPVLVQQVLRLLVPRDRFSSPPSSQQDD